MTQQQRWLSRKYLAYRFLTNLWFVEVVWLYFYRLFITDQQIGVLDAMAFAIGLAAEVPSGALADKFGRARIAKLGQILVGVGFLIQAIGGGFVPIFVGQAVLMIGAAFASGADEALFFEKLNFKRSSTAWRKLVTRASQVGLVASLTAVVVGGWLYTINPHVPFVVGGIAFIVGALVIWSVKDDKIARAKQPVTDEIGDYINNIREGFGAFSLPKLWLYVPTIVIVQGAFYTAGWGMLRPVLLARFHFDPFWGSVVVATCSLMTVGILAYMHKHADRLSEKRMITLISLSAAASLMLSLVDIGAWGFVVIFVLYAGDHVLHPFMSEVLNNRAPEKQRATVLSVASFLRSVPYVGLAPIIGYLSAHNQLEYFLVVWSVLIVAAVGMYVVLKKRDAVIDFKE